MLSQDSRIQTIAQYYGEEAQENVVQEECAELIQAISKDRRYQDIEHYTHMVEEMSDVYLVLSTLYCYLPPSYKRFFEDNFNAKLDRQLKRIEEEVEEKDKQEKDANEI